MQQLKITVAILVFVFAAAGIKSWGSSETQSSNSATTQSAASFAQSSTDSPEPAANLGQSAPSTVSGSTATPALNPEHGQPNHRCDIPVGTALNSAPWKGPASPLTARLNEPAPISTPSTATGMNPPHGQPNHRCDIAVGAPLDSPAGTGKSTPSINPQQNTPSQINTTPTAPGMNPPHGQPNHRCDIGVGVPLDSPPGTGKTAPAAGISPSTSTPPVKIVPAPK